MAVKRGITLKPNHSFLRENHVVAVAMIVSPPPHPTRCAAWLNAQPPSPFHLDVPPLLARRSFPFVPALHNLCQQRLASEVALSVHLGRDQTYT